MIMPGTATARRAHRDDEVSLPPSECRRWLRHHHEGRLSYLSGRGPRSVVVSYAVADDMILVPIPDYNEIAQYAPETEIRLDVGEFAADDNTRPAVEEVTVRGTARLRKSGPAGAVDELLGQTWPSSAKTSVLTLPLTRVEGFRRRLAPG